MRVPLNQRTFRPSVERSRDNGYSNSPNRSRFHDSIHHSPERSSPIPPVRRDSPIKDAVYRWIKQVSGK